MRHTRNSVPALLTILAMLLTACSASGGSGTAQARQQVHLTFWSALRGTQQVVDEYNRVQNKVRVDFQQVPSGAQGGYAKLSNAARAGNAPDVATIEYPQLPGFAIDGVPRDLTRLLPDSVRRKILPQALDLTTLDGHTYAVPVDIEPMMFFYRKDVFTKYGIQVPKTWAEFEFGPQTEEGAASLAYRQLLHQRLPAHGRVRLAGRRPVVSDLRRHLAHLHGRRPDPQGRRLLAAPGG